MAILGGTVLNWKDMVNSLDPNGLPAKAANLLEEAKPILSDFVWKASNQPLGHRSQVVTALPTPGFKRINRGTLSTKGAVTPMEEGLSMIEDFSTVDIKLLELYGNEGAMREEQGRMHVEGMGQLAVDTFWYGDVTDNMDEFNGFTTRYNTLATTNPIYKQIFDAGGSGSDLSSLWVLGHGDGKIEALFPKNCMAGLRHQDLGRQLIQQDTDLGGRKLSALVDQWNWDLGLHLGDYRYGVRIANIEPDELVGVTGTQDLADYATNVMYLLLRAKRRFPNLTSVRPRIYMPRYINEGLDVQALARTTPNVYSSVDVDGKSMEAFHGIPFRIEDALTNTETQVTT